MKLKISDRLNILTLFPVKASLLTQLTIKDVIEKVKLSEEERAVINFKIENTVATWDEKKASEKEIEFTNAEIGFLKDRVKTLDRENKITQSILSICLKIKEAE